MAVKEEIISRSLLGHRGPRVIIFSKISSANSRDMPQRVQIKHNISCEPDLGA